MSTSYGPHEPNRNLPREYGPRDIEPPYLHGQPDSREGPGKPRRSVGRRAVRPGDRNDKTER